MMRLILASCALALVSAGPALAEQRNLSGFTGVEASSGTDVTVTVGSAFSVDVSGPGADRVVTRVSESTLHIERRHNFWSWGPARRAVVRVTMPRVTALAASSGADLVATGVAGGDIALESSSGADLRVDGFCAALSADASSGADIHAEALRCDSGNVDASSGATARIFVSGRLDVDASSGGGVVNYGTSHGGNIDLSSGGTLRNGQ